MCWLWCITVMKLRREHDSEENRLSLASLSRRTIVLVELRCSPPPPRSLFPSSSPFSPWHNCCIAADVISCFLCTICGDYPLSPEQESARILSLFIFELCISFTQLSCNSYLHSVYLVIFLLMFCHVPLFSLLHLSLFAVLMCCYSLPSSCHCSEG